MRHSSSGKWLNDDIITACQNLLQLQCLAVGGLQHTALSQTFAIEPQAGEFVQISNISESHWITISTTIGCPAASVKVYDSEAVFSNQEMHCRSFDDQITVTYTNVQWQSGQDPTTCTIPYDQQKMHSHLLACILGGKISAFLQRSVSCRTNKMSSTQTELIPVYCVCRLLDDGGTMIKCHEWFHIRLPNKYLKHPDFMVL